jgi:hypothetical protein
VDHRRHPAARAQIFQHYYGTQDTKPACRFVYGDSDLIPTWMGVVEAANFISRTHKLFSTQTVHSPR